VDFRRHVIDFLRGTSLASGGLMFSLRSLLIVVLAPLLFGCGSDAVISEAAGPGAGGGDHAGGGGATSAPDPCPEAGVCAETSCGVVFSPSPPCEFEFTCDLPSPCEQVEFMVHEMSPGEDPNAPVTLSNPAAATCVLEALRDGVEGSYQWFVTRQINGQYATTVTAHVRPSRVALLGWYTTHDASSMRGFRGPAGLSEAAHFEQCLTESAPEVLLDCFGAAVTSCPSD
jgi:hypothetical protein